MLETALPPPLPLLVLTGFLGSGKTTLLNALLRDARFQDAAVIINEFGAVGLDHKLVVHARDRTVVLEGGCVCCALREDVEGALRELFDQRDRGEIPPFARVVIETSGLADPVPLLLTLQTFGLARARLAPPRVLATVDGVLGQETLERFPEAVRQVAAADSVLITKVDRAGSGQVEALRNAVEALNPWCGVAQADLRESGQGDLLVRLAALLEASPTPLPCVPGRPSRASPLVSTQGRYVPPGRGAAHGARSFVVSLEEPLDWGCFGVWLTLLLHRHGSRVLRVKGLVQVAGLPAPVAFHAAQHMVHPPEHLAAWPSADRRSHLVFIVLGLDPECIGRSLRASNALARRLAEAPPPHAVLPAGAGGTVRGRPVRRPTAPSWIRG